MPGLKEAQAGALQNDAGQDPRHIGAGIDADTVRAQQGVGIGRMAVDDDLAEIGRAVEELLADPEEVFLVLILERNAGFYARMDEIIIADGGARLERLEEAQMGSRKLLEK